MESLQGLQILIHTKLYNFEKGTVIEDVIINFDKNLLCCSLLESIKNKEIQTFGTSLIFNEKKMQLNSRKIEVEVIAKFKSFQTIEKKECLELIKDGLPLVINLEKLAIEIKFTILKNLEVAQISQIMDSSSKENYTFDSNTVNVINEKNNVLKESIEKFTLEENKSTTNSRNVDLIDENKNKHTDSSMYLKTGNLSEEGLLDKSNKKPFNANDTLALNPSNYEKIHNQKILDLVKNEILKVNDKIEALERVNYDQSQKIVKLEAMIDLQRRQAENQAFKYEKIEKNLNQMKIIHSPLTIRYLFEYFISTFHKKFKLSTRENNLNTEKLNEILESIYYYIEGPNLISEDVHIELLENMPYEAKKILLSKKGNLRPFLLSLQQLYEYSSNVLFFNDVKREKIFYDSEIFNLVNFLNIALGNIINLE